MSTQKEKNMQNIFWALRHKVLDRIEQDVVEAWKKARREMLHMIVMIGCFYLGRKIKEIENARQKK
jgi:hypothetical protein